MMNDLLAIAGIIPVFEFVSTHGAVEQADRWGIADTIRSQQADDTHLEHAHNEAAAAAAATAAAVATESSTIERKQHRSSPPTIGSSHERFDGDQVRRKALREANRVHCRETRERKRDAERLLREVSTNLIVDSKSSSSFSTVRCSGGISFVRTLESSVFFAVASC